MIRYPVDALWDEVAYLAYHLHWSLDDLLDLEHGDRVQLLGSVARLNERAWSSLRHAELR
jgi:hypothetical protein